MPVAEENAEQPVKLSRIQKAVYYAICDSDNISHVEMARKLYIAVDTARKASKRLRELGYVRRYGGNKFGYWEVLKKL